MRQVTAEHRVDAESVFSRARVNLQKFADPETRLAIATLAARAALAHEASTVAGVRTSVCSIGGYRWSDWDAAGHGPHSMRRANASLIYRRMKNLRAVQPLLGRATLESTVR